MPKRACIFRIEPANVGFLWLLLVCQIACGCASLPSEDLSDKSILPPLRKAPDQLELEVIFLQIPKSQHPAADQLWSEVDEVAVSADRRRQLWQNGFRVGVVGSQLPQQIAEIVQDAEFRDGSTEGEPQFADADEMKAIRRQMFVRQGQPGELVVASIRPELHLLQVIAGDLQGSTFHDAQPQFAVTASRTDDRRIQLTLAPEVHYGQFRQRYVPGEGMFRLENRRDKKVLDELEVQVTLGPGQIMMLGSDPARQGSLGHRFFNESLAAQSAGKLLFIRVGDSSFPSIFGEPQKTSTTNE